MSKEIENSEKDTDSGIDFEVILNLIVICEFYIKFRVLYLMQRIIVTIYKK